MKLPRATRLVMGFQYEADARRMLIDLRERVAKFGLTLHEDKTRLIEFGRLPALDRRRRAGSAARRSPSWASHTTVGGPETGASW